jgi:hypothetical protein
MADPYTHCKVESGRILDLDPRMGQSVLVGRQSSLTWGHWEAAVKVLRYVVGTLDLGVQFGGSRRDVVGYWDADYAGYY